MYRRAEADILNTVIFLNKKGKKKTQILFVLNGIWKIPYNAYFPSLCSCDKQIYFKNMKISRHYLRLACIILTKITHPHLMLTAFNKKLYYLHT